MANDRAAPDLDRELVALPPELRWREWVRRVEAVLFASASPVPREDLARVVGQGASVDLLVEDLIADLKERSFEVAKVKDGWMLRTRSTYAFVIKAAADFGDQLLDLNEFDVAVLAAVAYHQPITRDGLKDIFGKDQSDRAPSCAGVDRYWPTKSTPRCALHVCHHRPVSCSVRFGKLARSAGSRAAAGCGPDRGMIRSQRLALVYLLSRCSFL